MSQVLAVVAVAIPRVVVTNAVDATSPNVNIILLHSVGVTSTYTRLENFQFIQIWYQNCEAYTISSVSKLILSYRLLTLTVHSRISSTNSRRCWWSTWTGDRKSINQTISSKVVSRNCSPFVSIHWNWLTIMPENLIIRHCTGSSDSKSSKVQP